jgi:hypothetical protein
MKQPEEILQTVFGGCANKFTHNKKTHDLTPGGIGKLKNKLDTKGSSNSAR